MSGRNRIGRLRLTPRSPAAIGFTLACLGAALLLRIPIEGLAPGRAPFATLFPAILVVTLVAGLELGIVSVLLGAAGAWVFVVTAGADWTGRPGDGVALLVFLVSAGLMVAIGASARDLADRLEAAERRLKIDAEMLNTVIRSLPFPMMLYADDGEMLAMSDTCCKLTGYPRDSMRTIRDWISRAYPEDAEEMMTWIDRSFDLPKTADGGAFAVRAADGRQLIWDFVEVPLGRIDGRRLLLTAAQDVTERHEDDHLRQLRSGEAVHRLKNILATVKAIVTLTAGSAGDPEGVATRIAERLEGVAAAQDLMHANEHSRASLRALVRAELAPYADAARLSVAGPEVSLGPRLASSLALVLHELATNAAKYGPFSGPSGRLSIDWSVEGERLRIAWREIGGPAVTQPATSGFGTRLISHSLRGHDGKVELDFAPGGLVCQIHCSLADDQAETAEKHHPVVYPTLVRAPNSGR